MDRAKKKLASALDGLRLSRNKAEFEFDEKVTPQHVCFSKVVRHGFPYDPRCIAYDPMQRLIAIGTGSGIVRIFGDAGVDYCLHHRTEAPVTNIQFLINEGALVTACRDDLVHLWNYRQKIPEIVHSIQLNKEQITCVNLPFQSKWLYLGTERGNVYFVSVATFKLSTYVINWNKAIDLSCRTHPGCVKSILTCPTENTKILLLFEKGIVVLWNLQTKEVDRFIANYPVRSVGWFHDGRQFICGNSDGSLSVWNVKKPSQCVQKMTPHGDKCRPITQVDWSVTAEGEQLIMFSGGMSQEDGVLPAITILRANRSATVFEMEHPLIAFTPLTPPCFPSEAQHHFGLAVLLKSDLLVIDLESPGYPCFENVNPVDIHESPVVYVKYFSNCPVDLIGALTLVGCKQRRQVYSKKAWPVNGGTGRECATGHQELLITGHEDGSLKFWHSTGEHLQILYKLKTGRHFERSEDIDGRDISYAVADMVLCLESRLLVVCGQSSQITLFHFAKNESCREIAVVNTPRFTSLCTDDEATCSVGCARNLRQQSLTSSQDSHSTATSEGSTNDDYFPLKVRGGSMRRPAGYQPEMVCAVPWKSCSQPETITAVALNSAYGFLAFGTSNGLVVVDTIQYILVYTLSYLDFYGKESPLSASQGFEHSPNELSTPEQRSSPSPNSVKSFSKAISEMRQRSNEKQRPVLSKTHSVVEQPYEESLKDSGAQLFSDDVKSNGPGKRDSRSPSQTSQDKTPPADLVSSLYFIYSYSRKNDHCVGPCLWMGTTSGFCTVFNLQVPSSRISSPALVSPSGFFFRQRGQHLYTTFLDKSFCLLSSASNPFHDGKESSIRTENVERTVEKGFANKVITKSSLSPTFSNASDYEDEIEQVLVSVSEDEVRVVAMPSFSILFSHRPDIPFVQVRATHVRGLPVLALINSVGQIIVLSLPTLKHLLCTPLYQHPLEIGDSFCRKTSLSEYGLGFYSITPSEMQKFTICSELAEQVKECAGELFVPVDMPEPPKSSFFKGVSTLFAGAHKEEVDLDFIFGEKIPGVVTGSAIRSVGRTIPGPSSSIDLANSRALTASQAASVAVQAINERGEKLNATVDATERLMENAMSFSQRTSKLVEKYEKKKWYNF